MLAVFHALRLRAAFAQWDLLEEMLPVSPYFLAGDGLVWAMVGLVLAVGLWLGKGWARMGALLAGPLYALWRWIDHLAFASEAGAANLPFNLAVTVLGLGLLFWVLSRPHTRHFFGRVA